MKYLALLFFLVVIPFRGWSQSETTLLANLQKSIKNDTSRVATLLKLAEFYQYKDYTKTLNYSREAAYISRALGESVYEMKSLYLMAYSYTDFGKFDSSYFYYQSTLKLASEQKDFEYQAKIFNDLGYIYQTQGTLNKALENYQKSLLYFRKNNDTLSTAICLNNIGLVYQSIANFKKALEYFKESLALKEKTAHQENIAFSYNNIGAVLLEMDKFTEAEEWLKKGLYLRMSEGLQSGIAQSLSNLAALYKKQGLHQKSLDFSLKALQIYSEAKDVQGEVAAYNNIAISYKYLKQFDKAIESANKAIWRAMGINSPMEIRNAYLTIANCYVLKGDYRSGYQNYVEYVRYKDTTDNVELVKKVTQKGLQFEFDQKLRENQLKSIHAETLSNLKIARQQTIMYVLITGIGLLIILAFVVYNALKQKRKAHEEISSQKREIEEKSAMLEEALKDVTDSIRYAKRLQEAILPPEKEIKGIYPETFVLFKPKDIVSGDFYWIDKKGDDLFFAAADCTGHGVPGAFMSIVGHNLIKLCVNEFKLSNPASILDQLNLELTGTLKQRSDESVIRDGMDIALVRFNTVSRKLSFSGANNNIYLVSGGELEILPSTKQPVGRFLEDQNLPFGLVEKELRAGDMVYLFSDGYADQFGGSKGKKLKYNQFQQLLVQAAKIPVNSQASFLEEKFEKWKGVYLQVDDVLVLGFKVV